jgi:hypothetical protein
MLILLRRVAMNMPQLNKKKFKKRNGFVGRRPVVFKAE